MKGENMDELNDWLTADKTINRSRKAYAHFDLRTDICKEMNYIINPKNIASHSFYPFIHYQKSFIKYNNQTKQKEEKTRDICYAAHIDSCIFQLYSHILDGLFLKEIKRRNIYSVPIAYRTDLKKSNINFSKQAFDFMRKHNEYFVMIGDFTGFFDNLDHKYLKSQWCSLLKEKYLPPDHYAVFKNITKYSTWELKDILLINGLEDSKKGRKELNSKKRVLTKEQYRQYRSQICKNKNIFGIPQGSPISATLANIYMIDVDCQINEIVENADGLYLRYSDDFIIVLPTEEAETIELFNNVCSIISSTPGLTLQAEKTQFFSFADGLLKNCGLLFDEQANTKKKCIDFLGFSFDGTNVKIRDKTQSKYYYRLYRKAKTITKNEGYTPSGKKISAKNIYMKYSIRGAGGKVGNFLSYVIRSEKEYSKSNSIGYSSISKIKKRNMQKIHHAIKG